jgi:hypothetical protein
MLWDWPNMDFFDDSTSCEGTPTTVVPFSTTCVASTSYDIDYLTYYNYSLVNSAAAVPTFQPSGGSGTNSNSNDDSMSSIGGTAGLAGIIVGGAVLVGILLGVMYYYVSRKPAEATMKSPLINDSQN